MTQSMSAKGNCYDNAVAESFFHTLKLELDYQEEFESKQEAYNEVLSYIEFYNTIRTHSHNGYTTPLEAEMSWWQQNKKFAYAA